MKTKDADKISRLTHGLKEELGNLRAREAYILVSQLQEMAEHNDLNRSLELLIAIEGEIKEMREFSTREGWL